MNAASWRHGPPKKILLATDLSARCDRALDRAAALAALWQAELLALHVMEAPSGLGTGAEALPSWRLPPDPQQVADRRVRADLGEVAPDVTVLVETGDPAETILDTAQARGCDLIVVGMARDEPLGRLSLGATVGRLLRRSPVPVLIVKQRGQRPYRHLVVATDFSESSRHALEAAARFFPQHRLTLVHARDEAMSVLVSDVAAHRDQFRDAAAHDGQAFLDSADLGNWPERPQIVLGHGAPDRVICEHVADKHVDLVVLGTQGRSALFEVLLGSVARKIIDSLPCDALVVRTPQDA